MAAGTGTGTDTGTAGAVMVAVKDAYEEVETVSLGVVTAVMGPDSGAGLQNGALRPGTGVWAMDRHGDGTAEVVARVGGRGSLHEQALTVDPAAAAAAGAAAGAEALALAGFGAAGPDFVVPGPLLSYPHASTN